ncbi:hypothetical protein FOZ61_001212, partial [Perkinsus olseni]
SFSQRVQAAQVDIAELRDRARVDNDLWFTMCEALAGEEGHLVTVADLGFMHPGDVSAFFDSLENALDRSRAGILYELCREACGLPNVLVTTAADPAPESGPVRDASSSSVEPPRKKAKMSLFIDAVDESSFAVVSPQTYDSLVSAFRKRYGDVEDVELPTLEQLSGVQAKVLEGSCPYCDFSVFTVAPRERLRRLKAQGWSFNQEGEAQRVGSLRIPTFAEWLASFELFSNALLMLEVATSADLKKYKQLVSGLQDTYKDFWLQIYSADDFMRSVRLPRYKTSDEVSWGACFVAACVDLAYWADRVDRVIFKLRAAGATSSPAPSSAQASGVPASTSTPSTSLSSGKKRQICFAYQSGRHGDGDCPAGRRHAGIVVRIPDEKLRSVLALAESALSKRCIPVKMLRRVCGKFAWIGQTVPFVHAFVSPLWRCLGWADRHSVSAVRVESLRPSLVWLKTFINLHFESVRQQDAAEGCYSRVYPCASLTTSPWSIVVDASTTGVGGVLYEGSRPVSWFADSLKKVDFERFDSAPRDCKRQAVWEALAILIACRLWLPSLPRFWTVKCCSDSRTALSSLMSLKSRSKALILIAQELALDCALEGRWFNLSFSHVPGASNQWADALSRLSEGISIPSALESVPRVPCPDRSPDAGFWRVADPPQCIAMH